VGGRGAGLPAGNSVALLRHIERLEKPGKKGTGKYQAGIAGIKRVFNGPLHLSE
jgi:hypothetical protein